MTLKEFIKASKIPPVIIRSIIRRTPGGWDEFVFNADKRNELQFSELLFCGTAPACEWLTKHRSTVEKWTKDHNNGMALQIWNDMQYYLDLSTHGRTQHGRVFATQRVAQLAVQAAVKDYQRLNKAD